MSSTYEFEVSFSFAGEDRAFVKEVASYLVENNVKVFYDEFQEIDLWGKDLYVYLDEIYRKKSRYCVVFISKHYKEKLWTNHERESAQARAFQENSEYILPFRLDDTEIPGIKPTTGYLSSKNISSQKLAEAISKKINAGSPQLIEELSDDTSKVDTVIENGVVKRANGEYEIKVRKYDFVGHRLAKAFPGVRELVWYDNPVDILKRLKILLRDPLEFELYPGKHPDLIGGKATPFWWFRGGGSMAIDDFKIINETKFLLGMHEFEINRIAVYRSNREYQSFIYFETKAETPINTGEDIERSKEFQLEYRSYAIQQYGLYKNVPIKREEIDDGSAVINNEVVNLAGEAVSRIRYLTPYNFIICAQSSIYNTHESDRFFGDFMDDILRGNNSRTLESILPDLLKIEREKRIEFSESDL